MAFILSIDRESGADFVKLSGNGEIILTCPVGFDDEDGTVYSTFLALATVPGMADQGVYDLVFRLVRSEPNEQVFNEYDDGQDTRRVIPSADDRETILAAFCASASLAVGDITPAIAVGDITPAMIYIATSRANLPEPALRKFDVICDTLRNLGYGGGRCDSYHGLMNWIMIADEDLIREL